MQLFIKNIYFVYKFMFTKYMKTNAVKNLVLLIKIGYLN